jgi:hypothetical protein
MIKRRQMHKAFLLREPEGNKPLGRHSCRFEDNIKTDVK